MLEIAELEKLKSLLPAPAVGKIEAIDRQAREARAITAALGDDYRYAYDTVLEKQALIARIENDPYHRTANPEHGARIDFERETLTKMHARRDEIGKRRDDAGNLASASNSLVVALKNYAFSLAEPVSDAEKFTPKKVSDPAAAIKDVRAKIEAAQQDLYAAHDAPLPSSKAREIIRNQIESMAEAGRPNVLPVLESGEALAFAMKPRGEYYGELDVMAALAFFFKDAMLAKLNEVVADDADDSCALDDAARARAIADAKAKKLAAERDEEQLIEQAATNGVTIARRPAADPRAVLGVVGPEPKEG